MDIAPYNLIKKVKADENGVISVEYTHDQPDENLGQLTFLLETLITKPNSGYDIEGNHLLALFSTRSGNITYYSEKFKEPTDGYIDLGYVKGDPGPGLSVIAKYDNVSDIPSNPNIIPNYQIGCGVAVGTAFYIFDVNSKQWVYIGDINDINPENVIRVTKEDQPDTDFLQENGIWFVTSTIKFAE